MREMAQSIANQFINTAKRLAELGLNYLTLDRAGNTLSTGERQRVQLARAVRNQTTGVLYVLDEPSIGLHPSNVDGLLGMIRDLISRGNSVVLVDHDTRVLKAADWLIEMGTGAGTDGGSVIAAGTVKEIIANPLSLIGKYLAGKELPRLRPKIPAEELFENGTISISTKPLHTVHALELKLPKGRLTAVTGVSGSGKTTLLLESLVPALQAKISRRPLPGHVKALEAEGIERVNIIDAAPIGANIRSTVATYSGILDELRRIYAGLPAAKAMKKKAGDFSYNTGALRCPACDGTGQITMDIQFLPDVEITCPECGGSRYSKECEKIRWLPKKPGQEQSGVSLPELMNYTIAQTLELMPDVKKIRERLETLCSLGLGYLTLGEATPALSGGEAQRLKIAYEMGKSQTDAVFVFDEPTIGLHPLDIRVLTDVFQRLIEKGATVIVIEHDLDMIANADYIVDMGPGGGQSGGRIVAAGVPEQIIKCSDSLTGRYLKDFLENG